MHISQPVLHTIISTLHRLSLFRMITILPSPLTPSLFDIFVVLHYAKLYPRPHVGSEVRLREKSDRFQRPH